MSVTLGIPGLPPSYGPLSGNNSQSAKLIARAEQLQQKATTQAVDSHEAGIRANSATQGLLEAGDADPTDVGQFQSSLVQALRLSGATAGSSTSGTSAWNGRQSSTGTALYKLVSQMGDRDPSTSALLRSWNSIMQSGQDGRDAGAAALQTFLQTEAPALEPGGLDLTA